MFSPTRILVPTDFSRCAEQALALAVALARRYHAELHVLRVTPFRSFDPYNPLYELRDRAPADSLRDAEVKAQLRASLASHDLDGINVRLVHRTVLEVGPSIVDYAAEAQAQLVVLGTHGHRGLRYLLLGSVAAEVVRLAPCPVLTVREQPAERHFQTWSRILVPIDFSESSLRALRVAGEVSTALGARMDLLHVVPRIHPLTLPDTSCATTDELEHSCCQEAQAALERLCADKTLPPHSTQQVVLGQPADRIVHQAGELASDLILIATHGRTGFTRFLLGSVTEKVVRHSPCPVLTLKQ